MKRRIWLKAIAVWQMLGGAIGAATFLAVIAPLNAPIGTRLVLLAVLIPICLLSGVAGWGLLKARRWARGPSLLVQGLQLFGVGTTGFMARLCLGPYVYFYVINGTGGIEAGFSPQANLYWRQPPMAPHLVVNLLAAVCIVMLLRWEYITEFVPPKQAPEEPSPEAPPATTAWPPINWPK